MFDTEYLFLLILSLGVLELGLVIGQAGSSVCVCVAVDAVFWYICDTVCQLSEISLRWSGCQGLVGGSAVLVGPHIQAVGICSAQGF